MKPQGSFTKDDPAYPGMIGLIAATTATDCKCSRCEHLRTYLPPEVGALSQSEGFKTKTKQMYEDVLNQNKNRSTLKTRAYRDRLRQTPEGRQRLRMYEDRKKEKYGDMWGTPQHEARKQQMREYINSRRQRERNN